MRRLSTCAQPDLLYRQSNIQGRLANHNTTLTHVAPSPKLAHDSEATGHAVILAPKKKA